jgi:MOSC domain-containing protein YiiM
MRVLSLNVGRPKLLMHDGQPYSTAFNRTPVEGPVELGLEGLAGDRVADKRYHGGPQKAMLLYPHEHYAWLEQKLGRPIPLPSFGENLTLEGLTEEQACVGDVYEIGSAVVQASEPREPCFKLARKHHTPALVKWVHETGFGGFYVRVLKTGTLQCGDELRLIERPHPQASMFRLFKAMLWNDVPAEELAEIAALESLSVGWRTRLLERAEKKK